jgi:glycosyltransferase involved in cell wall biosynthesis
MDSSSSIIVTIGFCVKDVSDTIRDAIRSISKQDLSHALMELIVVEGFSRDQTYSIVKNDLSEVDIDCKIYRDDKGLGAARQTVVNKAHGTYIVWVDGDMILPDDYVRKQVEFMENNPSVAIAGGKYGLHLGQGAVADLENLVYVVDSLYGEKAASRFGHVPGTEGAICRVKAIRQAGGFDVSIKGAAEDTELACRLVVMGWDLRVANQIFTESTRKSLFSLWHQYFWYGYGGHFIFHKNADMLTLWKMTPPAGFMAGLLRFSSAYRLTHRKMVFLLPLHYTFKRIAWLFGFFRAHFEGYGHVKAY